MIRNLSHCDEIREANVDVVTLDGDRRGVKGVLSGGYFSEAVIL